ncbi:hypothetical protein BGX27_002777 [Mortierella sp. AM989]|nr:hypothetical protein BGX27_002777 [Mortierella sp. AM989]
MGEFNELKLDNSSSYPSTLKAPLNSSISQEDKRKNLPDTFTAPTRSAAHFSDSHYTSTSRMLDNASRSRTSSPEINEINWSPKKTVPPASSRLPAAFGMYRDSNQSSRQDDSMLASTSQLGTTGSFLEQQASGQNGLTYKTDNKFRSRAYEPSPLANPSLVTNMGLSNMSLGEMFGFPSAKFQPPENHFAHRSANHQGAGASGAWSYRKATDTGGALGLSQSSTHRTHSRFSQNADVDMGDDDSQKLTSRLSTDTDADHTDTMFSSFGLGPTSSRSENNSNTNGRGAFAAQRYFPPEPETGLEDNFFGIVKIVDDYLPPQQGPRSIAGRNLMLKKRMARRWLGTMGGGSRLDLVGQAIFIGVILHATAFWLLDEYRLLRRYLDKESIDKKKSARDMDPFEPTTMDRICSYLLLLLLAARILNMTSWVFVDNVFGSLSATEDVCLPQDGILSECHRSATYSPNLMDWSPRVIQRVYPKVDGKEAARLLAFYAGWVHDIVMMALLAVLIAFGAGSALIKSYSSTTQEHKVKKRGS